MEFAPVASELGAAIGGFKVRFCNHPGRSRTFPLGHFFAISLLHHRYRLGDYEAMRYIAPIQIATVVRTPQLFG
jgi:hypothetical protein